MKRLTKIAGIILKHCEGRQDVYMTGSIAESIAREIILMNESKRCAEHGVFNSDTHWRIVEFEYCPVCTRKLEDVPSSES